MEAGDCHVASLLAMTRFGVAGRVDPAWRLSVGCGRVKTLPYEGIRKNEPGGTHWRNDSRPAASPEFARGGIPAEPSGSGKCRIAAHRARIVCGHLPAHKKRYGSTAAMNRAGQGNTELRRTGHELSAGTCPPIKNVMGRPQPRTERVREIPNRGALCTKSQRRLAAYRRAQGTAFRSL